MERVPETRAVFAVIEQLDDNDAFLADRIADLGYLRLIRIRALKEAAITADDLVMVISGQLLERFVAENNRIIFEPGICETDSHSCLPHRLFEQQSGSAVETLPLNVRGEDRTVRLVGGLQPRATFVF